MVSRHSRRGLWWALAVLTGALPTLASAQAPPPSAAPLQQATDEQKTAARDAYGAGRTAFEAGDFGGALQHFQASYAYVNSPNSLLMVGNCQRELGQRAIAHGTYSEVQALAEASGEDRYAAASESAAEKLAELDAQLATVQVTVEGSAEGAQLTVGDREIPAERWQSPIVVEPGVIRIVLSEGERSADEVVELAAGGSTEVRIGLPEPPPPLTTASVEVGDSPLDYRTLAYVAGGIGVAGLLTFAITGAMSDSRFGDLEDGCDAQMRCPSGLKDTADSGQTLQTVANVSLVIGALGAIAGVTFYVLSTDEQDAALSVGPAGARFEGRF